MSSTILHALDIGEYKIRCFSAIAESGDKTSFKILGFSEADNSAMINGNITDLDRFKKILKTTITECEEASSVTIDELIVGIGGSDVESIYANSKTQINESSRKVTTHDIDALLRYCRQSEVRKSQSVVSSYFLNFRIDERDQIVNPINQIGEALYGKVHLVTVSKNFRDTISETIDELARNVSAFVTEHEASYYVVKNPDEKIFATVDIGYKNTNVSVFDNARLMYTKSIDLGGYYFVSDLSNVINLSRKEGARVLDELTSRLNSDESLDNATVSVTTLAEKKVKVPLSIAYQIIEARMSEIAKKVVSEITASGYYQSENNEKILEDGLYLLGGSVNITSFKEIFMSQMDIKTQIGKVSNITDFKSLINKPEYSTVLGLFNAGLIKIDDTKKDKSLRGQGSKISIIQTLLNFIDKLF